MNRQLMVNEISSALTGIRIAATEGSDIPNKILYIYFYFQYYWRQDNPPHQRMLHGVVIHHTNAVRLSYQSGKNFIGNLLVVTETWHERSDSTELRRLTPPSYRCIDAARPLPPGANVDTLGFRNYGGLAFICRQSLRLQKKHLDASPTTFEFLCGSAFTASCHFILLGVYRQSGTVGDVFCRVVGRLSVEDLSPPPKWRS